jgi:hypothetical protein
MDVRNYYRSLCVPVMVGVAQTFDFHFTGRAYHKLPGGCCEHDFEWLFRLACEPKDSGRRYLIYGSEFCTGSILGRACAGGDPANDRATDVLRRGSLKSRGVSFAGRVAGIMRASESRVRSFCPSIIAGVISL